MTATAVKIDNKKYRIISEEDYLTLMQDISDLKKVLKRRAEPGIEAKLFLKPSLRKNQSYCVIHQFLILRNPISLS